MEFDPIKLVMDWLPTFITAVVVVGLYYAVDKTLQNRAKGKSSMVAIKAISLFSIALLGFIFVILSAPISTDLKGQITSLFGIIISAGLAISSATFITNALAGIMLRSVNHYKIGDFVQVGDIFGRVTERGFFHTEIQSEDRDLITLPNSHLANNPVKVIRASGTFISVKCSLGYDVNHNDIRKALLKAIADAGLEDGFVQIKELGDYSVVYQAFGLLRDAKTVISTRSRLHASMLDCLHDADIEIVSPSFMNQRQVAGTVFIPKKAKGKAIVEEQEQIEQLIFDKADKAESIEHSKENLAQVTEKLTALKEELKKQTNELAKKDIQTKIERYEKFKTRLETAVTNKVDDLKEKD